MPPHSSHYLWTSIWPITLKSNENVVCLPLTNSVLLSVRQHRLIQFLSGGSDPSRLSFQFRNSLHLQYNWMWFNKWRNENKWQKDTHHLRDCWGLKLLWPFSDEMSPSSLCRFATDWNSAGSCFSMHRIHRILWMTEYAQNIQNTLNMIRQWVSVPV